MAIEVKNLEIMLMKQEYELDKILLRLDEEIVKFSQGKLSPDFKICKLLSTIKSIKSELKNINSESEEIANAQKKLKEKAINEVTDITNELAQTEYINRAAEEDTNHA